MRMKWIVFALLLAGLAALPAWAQEAAKTEGKAEPAKQSGDAKEQLVLVGKSYLVGASNFPIVEFSAEGGAMYSLGGPRFEELKRLQNIKIKINAVPAGKKLQYNHLDVYDFEILDVGDGIKPFYGTLLVSDGVVKIQLQDAGEPLKLTGNEKILEKLAEANGGRAWVAGNLEGAALRVQRFRVLTTGAEKKSP
ncbi:MAG: hypothetical protein C4523_11815 [Myxococcales bacterium]|nr:MAG: hypothetical protein C4523_11815 [Myxococcales bacterium]